jgi:hypothetical protein
MPPNATVCHRRCCTVGAGQPSEAGRLSAHILRTREGGAPDGFDDRGLSIRRFRPQSRAINSEDRQSVNFRRGPLTYAKLGCRRSTPPPA